MSSNKRSTWLIGNGYNIQFAPDNLKNWWKFSLNLPLETTDKDSFSWANAIQPEFGKNLFELFGESIGKEKENSFLFLLVTIIKKVFSKIEENTKLSENNYYEVVLENTLKYGFAKKYTTVFNSLEISALKERKDMPFSNNVHTLDAWISHYKNNNMFYTPTFMILSDILLVKCKFINAINYVNFKRYFNKINFSSNKILIEPDDAKWEFNFKFLSISSIFSKIYLKLIQLWVITIRKVGKISEYDDPTKNVNSNNFLKFFKDARSTMLNDEYLYTTNYFNVCEFLYYRKFKFYNNSSDEFDCAVFLNEKIQSVKNHLDWLRETKVNEENKLFKIKELNIFGLNPQMDTDLINALISFFEITDLVYWYYNFKDKINAKKILNRDVLTLNRDIKLNFNSSKTIWNYCNQNNKVT